MLFRNTGMCPKQTGMSLSPHYVSATFTITIIVGGFCSHNGRKFE